MSFHSEELLKLLEKGFNYMNSHPDNIEQNQALIERSQPIIKELKSLGIPEQVSLDLLLLGIPIREGK